MRRAPSARSSRPGLVALAVCAVASIAGVASASGQSGAPQATAPVFATSLEIVPVGGHVSYTTPGGQPTSLVAARLIPVGSTVDTTNGTVRLISTNASGVTQSGVFSDGPFTVRQPPDEGGMVEASMTGTLPSCGKATTARASAPRHLRNQAPQDFGVTGYSARTTPLIPHYAEDAASSETNWDTVDGCVKGHVQTLVTVTTGAVTVSNPMTHKRVPGGAGIVRAGSHRAACYSGSGRFVTTGRYGAATIRGSADVQASAARLDSKVLQTLRAIGSDCG